MRSRRAQLAALAGLLTVSVAAAACGSGSGSSGSQDKNVTVAALPVVDTAGFFIALKQGYFRQQGLNVQYKIVAQSTAALASMVSGSVDVIDGGNYVSFIEAQNRGAVKLSLLADASACAPHTYSILTVPRTGIKKPADLAGKTVAVNLTNNIQTLAANAVLKADGVNTSAVKYVAVPFPQMGAALAAGRVDAISVVEPFLTQAKNSLHATEVSDQCAGPTAGLPLSGTFATQKWSQQNPATARAFQRALEKGQAMADSNPAMVKQILPTYSKTSPQIAAQIGVDKYPSAPSATDAQRIADLMLAGGLLKSHFSAASMLFH
jgi:NitT/TauT family transport system substrate-binding protein